MKRQHNKVQHEDRHDDVDERGAAGENDKILFIPTLSQSDTVQTDDKSHQQLT